ncbi:MAG TPA: CBS domain-containing protein [Bacillota bacterium]|nr:CBS domain-containing protein [Bacillota bacterium]
MFVRNHMTKSPITINPKTGIFDALEIMKKHKIRRLPVVSEGKVIGMVTEKELLTVSPSPATSLSIYEMNYLLAKMTVEEAMVKDPLTVTPDTTIEEAALLMRERKIGSLPVLDDGKLVGIITATDIFDALVKFFGYGRAGTRLVVEAGEREGLLADVIKLINDFNIPILDIIYLAKDNQNIEMMLRLGTVEYAPLVEAMKKMGLKLTYVS